MFSLLFIIFGMLAIISYRRWKKQNFKLKTGSLCALFITGTFTFVCFVIVLAAAVMLICYADVPAKYASEQEKLVSIQAEIEELKDNYGKVSYDEFTAEYEKLNKELEETQEYIANNTYYMEHGRSKAKFRLYFGG